MTKKMPPEVPSIRASTFISFTFYTAVRYGCLSCSNLKYFKIQRYSNCAYEQEKISLKTAVKGPRTFEKNFPLNQYSESPDVLFTSYISFREAKNFHHFSHHTTSTIKTRTCISNCQKSISIAHRFAIHNTHYQLPIKYPSPIANYPTAAYLTLPIYSIRT